MKKTIIFLLFIISLSACKKQNCLPDITANGANTLGFKLNGKVLKTSGYNSCGFGINLFDCTGVSYSGWAGTQDSSMMFSAKGADPYFSLHFDFKYDNGLGTYHSFNKTNVQYTCTLYANNEIYETDSMHIATINVTKADLLNSMIAGTFAMDLVNSKNEVVHVSDGRFDIKKE